MSENRKTLGLVLGAGGARGACHIGVIKELQNSGIPIDYITGSSMGAVIGGVYASGTDIEVIEKKILKVKMTDVLDVNLRVIKSGGFFGGRKAVKLIDKMLTAKTFGDCKIPFRCVAVDLNKGDPYIFDSGKLSDGIRASFSIPGVFEPVKKDGMLLVDGGVLLRLPIDAMEEFAPDVVVLVDALGEQEDFTDNPNIFQTIFRTFEVLDWKNTKKMYNRGDVRIVPKMDAGQFTTKTVPVAIEAGAKACRAKINRIKKLLSIEE